MKYLAQWHHFVLYYRPVFTLGFFFSHNSIKSTPETPAENNLCPGILHRFEGHFHCENIEQFQSEDIFCYLTSIKISYKMYTDPPQGRDRTSTCSPASPSRLSPPGSPCGGPAAWREGSQNGQSDANAKSRQRLQHL